MPKYQKPKISSKKIKLNFFLTNISPIDSFTIIGDVYAGSGDCACGGNVDPNQCSCSGPGGCAQGCASAGQEGCIGGCQGGCGCGCQNSGLSCTGGCSGGGSGNSGSGSCNSGG